MRCTSHKVSWPLLATILVMWCSVLYISVISPPVPRHPAKPIFQGSDIHTVSAHEPEPPSRQSQQRTDPSADQALLLTENNEPL
jgi:hypothetical protein